MPAQLTLDHSGPSSPERPPATEPWRIGGRSFRGGFWVWLVAGRRFVGQAVRFAGVGASGLVVALGVLNAVMAAGRAFVLANVLAFVLAVSWNFWLNRWLTFPATDRPLIRQWLEFLGGSFAAAVLNWAVAGALYYRGGFFYDHYNAAALTGTAVAAGANFLWARGRVFRPSTTDPQEPIHA